MSPVERAFAAARTGRFHSLSELLRALRGEGISEFMLSGPTLRRQLSEALRGRPAANAPTTVRQPRRASRKRWLGDSERARMLAAMCES